MFWPRKEKGASGASSSETTRRSRQPHASARRAGGEHQRKQANGAKEQGWADMHMRARACAGKWQPLSGHKNPVGKSRIIGPRRADVRGGQTRGAAGSAQLGRSPHSITAVGSADHEVAATQRGAAGRRWREHVAASGRSALRPKLMDTTDHTVGRAQQDHTPGEDDDEQRKEREHTQQAGQHGQREQHHQPQPKPHNQRASSNRAPRKWQLAAKRRTSASARTESAAKTSHSTSSTSSTSSTDSTRTTASRSSRSSTNRQAHKGRSRWTARRKSSKSSITASNEGESRRSATGIAAADACGVGSSSAAAQQRRARRTWWQKFSLRFCL